VLVLALAGCSAAPDSDEAPAAQRQVDTPEAVPADSPTPTPEPEPSSSEENPEHWGTLNAEEFYLGSLAGTWRGDGEPTPEEWLAYGQAACDAVAAGTPEADVQVFAVATTDDQWNNRQIVFVAQDSICYDGMH